MTERKTPRTNVTEECIPDIAWRGQCEVARAGGTSLFLRGGPYWSKRVFLIKNKKLNLSTY